MFALVSTSCTKSQPNKLTIATAANMQYAMEDIIEEFEKETGVKCNMVVSSSGKLTAQIIEGAPYDVFFSADLRYPNMIYESGLGHSLPVVYAKGALVLWSNEITDLSIELLTSSNIEHIAIANPKTAPYGLAALNVLDHYKISDTLKTKLVYGESIAQVNQFVLTQSAQVGFTAKSVVLSRQLENKGNWKDIDPKTYELIKQSMIVVNRNQEQLQLATRMQEFVLTDKSKNILEQFGYVVY